LLKESLFPKLGLLDKIPTFEKTQKTMEKLRFSLRFSLGSVSDHVSRVLLVMNSVVNVAQNL